MHINVKKSISKVDIFMGILDIPGHFAQRGHQSPSDIEMDISDFKWHFAINIEYHLLDFSSISGPNYLSITSAINLDIMIKADGFIRVIHLSYICLLNISDINIKAEQFISVINLEHHRLNFNSISGPYYISVTSAINLDILIKADSSGPFIHHTSTCSTTQALSSMQKGLSVPSIASTTCWTLATSPQPSTLTVWSKRRGSSEPLSHLTSTCSTTLTSRSRQRGSSGPFVQTTSTSSRASTDKTPSGDHQQTSKSHREASSMNTSVEHIIYVCAGHHGQADEVLTSRPSTST